MSASVNLPLLHKVQKFSSGASSPGWSRKKGRKTVVLCKNGSMDLNALYIVYDIFPQKDVRLGCR